MDGIIIRTGASPLDYPEFAEIREEINKLSHPSQPEISWSRVEAKSLSLFRQNGVDLQTAVYYTLARLHRSGLAGLTEGCELIAMMVVHDRETLWPPQINHRIDILNWFITRAMAVVRRLTFSRDDLRLLYRAERALQLITERLTQTPSGKTLTTDNLQFYFRNAATEIEQPTPAAESELPPVTLAPLVYIAEESPAVSGTDTAPAGGAGHSTVRFVQIAAETPPAPRKTFPFAGFAAGLLTGLILIAVLFFTVYKPVKDELDTFAAQPGSARVMWFADPQLATYGQLLTSEEQQSPAAALLLTEKITETARQRWPNDPDQAYATRRWQDVLQTRIADASQTDSWYLTGKRLQALTDTIVAREKDRGSFTLSYLKTEIHNIQQAHSKTTPAEEYLRVLSDDIRNGKPVSAAQLHRIDLQLNGLIALYADLQKQAEQAGLKPGNGKQE
ncbi:VasL domain-containing protein [Morganella sp. Je.2.23]|uniref:VasL domain-containing protein n=1 Tax=Morganella sp. Je.2.23 TaxID=3142840 RepID=UPI003DA87343